MSYTSGREAARVFAAAFAITILLFCSAAADAGTETWNFDVETSGEDVSYVSTTAVCNTAPQYHAVYAIDLVEVTVSYLGIPFGPFDVTDQIPPDQMTGESVYAGPPPFVVMNGQIRYPEEPDPITVAADVLMMVDAAGYGHVSVTNVVLGTALYDLGWPFGVVTVQIETIRVAGTLWITPLVPADLDGDGDVDLSDLSQLLGHYGTLSGATYEDGDLDGDGDVDLSDLAELLGNYGLWDC